MVDAATASIGLDAQHTVEIGRIHHTVFSKDVVATARNLTAYHHAAMTIGHGTFAYNDILARYVGPQAISVSSTLQGDTVVTRMECTALDKHIFARLWVAAITVRSFIEHLHIAHDDIPAQQGMHHPEGRIEQFHTLDEHILAANKVHQLRTQALALAKHALFYRHILVTHLEEFGTGSHLGCTLPLVHTFMIAMHLMALHIPPAFIAAIAIDNTLARQSDIHAINSIDTGLIIHEVKTLPTGINQRIKVSVEGKYQFGSLFHYKIDIALEGNGTGVPLSGRHHHSTASGFRTFGNGLVNGLLVLGGRGFGRGTILGNQVGAVSKSWCLDVFFDLFVLGVPCRGHHGHRIHHQ